MSIDFWLVFGLGAQFAFFLRFFVQWVCSEKEGRSVIPVHFWYLSLAGGIGLLIYSIHIMDVVFITGQSFGILIYLRNIILIQREMHAEKDKRG